jgi:hypothetical protein
VLVISSHSVHSLNLSHSIRFFLLGSFFDQTKSYTSSRFHI